MKKRIIAAALAAVVALNLCSLRPKAEAAAAAVIGIGILAFNLLGVMTGQYDDVANGIGCFIENGVEGWQKAFVGSDDCPSWFASGWQQIYDTCSGWLTDGSISLDDDGKVRMKYSQYLELCGLVGNAYADFNLTFSTDINYISFKAEPDLGIYILDSTSVLGSSGGIMSYMPIYYSEDLIYFPSSSAYFNYIPYSPENDDGTVWCSCWFQPYDIVGRSYSGTYGTIMNGRCNGYIKDFLATYLYSVSANSSSFSVSCSKWNANASTAITWTSYDGLSFENVAALDTSGLSFGYLNFEGMPREFFDSLSGYNVSAVGADVDDLSDDLSPILDKTKDPTLEIDTDPSIATPADAVTVTDIPGTADVTIAQLREKTNVDIDIPSVISTKFPFCIPFDFIRIIGVLCADPVAPVFRIPISTDPENLKGFEGNQTIGELPEDFTPMFEIDEELVLDLSAVPLVQPICYTVFIISFVVLLIFSTNKMINH